MSMQQQSLGLLALFSIGLAGCSATRPYVAPQSGPTAQLRIVTSMLHTHVNADDCSDNRAIVRLAALNTPLFKLNDERRLGMPLPPSKAPRLWTELLIPANPGYSLNLAGTYQGGMKEYNCFVNLAFSPQAGQQYELDYDFVPFAKSYRQEDDACQVRVSRLVGRPDGQVERQPVEFQLKDRLACARN